MARGAEMDRRLTEQKRLGEERRRAEARREGELSEAIRLFNLTLHANVRICIINLEFAY